MANILWRRMPKEKQDEYKKFLKIFGGLSGLFKDAREGENAKNPIYITEITNNCTQGVLT